MNKETLYELRNLVALYPYYQPARLLMLTTRRSTKNCAAPPSTSPTAKCSSTSWKRRTTN